jgi:hypothetical protein
MIWLFWQKAVEIFPLLRWILKQDKIAPDAENITKSRNYAQSGHADWKVVKEQVNKFSIASTGWSGHRLAGSDRLASK